MATNNGEDDQANEKNEELRREYHDLQNKISRCDINATEGLDIANEKLERVQRPQEAYLDSKIVFTCVRKIKEDADARRGRRSIFKTNEFSGLLKSSKYEDNGKIDWTKIGSRVQHAHRRPAPLEYLYGAFEKEEKKPEEAAAAKPRKKPVKPSELVATKYSVQTAASKDQAPKGPDVTELVKHVERDLKKCCKHSKNGICLFEFVLHPTSFSETVRHLFLTSFLVKEKKASIVMKEPNKPRIYYGESGGQLIFTINKSQWTKMVDLMNIREPKIKLPESTLSSTE